MNSLVPVRPRTLTRTGPGTDAWSTGGSWLKSKATRSSVTCTASSNERVSTTAVPSASAHSATTRRNAKSCAVTSSSPPVSPRVPATVRTSGSGNVTAMSVSWSQNLRTQASAFFPSSPRCSSSASLGGAKRGIPASRTVDRQSSWSLRVAWSRGTPASSVAARSALAKNSPASTSRAGSAARISSRTPISRRSRFESSTGWSVSTLATRAGRTSADTSTVPASWPPRVRHETVRWLVSDSRATSWMAVTR